MIPIVTIITTVHNGEEFIEECIEETDPIEEVVEDSSTLQRSPAKKKKERSQKQMKSQGTGFVP